MLGSADSQPECEIVVEVAGRDAGHRSLQTALGMIFRRDGIGIIDCITINTEQGGAKALSTSPDTFVRPNVGQDGVHSLPSQAHPADPVQ